MILFGKNLFSLRSFAISSVASSSSMHLMTTCNALFSRSVKVCSSSLCWILKFVLWSCHFLLWVKLLFCLLSSSLSYLLFFEKSTPLLVIFRPMLIACFLRSFCLILMFFWSLSDVLDRALDFLCFLLITKAIALNSVQLKSF